ncbi:MAG: hypothetical protein BroJett014_04620 [Planctomycetota bacterium]|nr:MAG: hypothetical protein BroJett014_04620 [Planctomycetota bacterium]
MHLSIRNLRAHVCAERRGRYSLNQIALTDNGSVSTDGQTLLLVPYPHGNGRHVPSADKPILISPTDASRIASLAKEKPKGKRRGYSAEEEKTIEVKLPESVLRVSTSSEGRVHETTVNIQEGEFPRMGRVVPDFSKALAVTFELDALLNTLKTLRLASNSKCVTLRVINADEGAGFSTDDGVGVLLMPSPRDADHPHAKDALALIRESATGGEPDTGPTVEPSTDTPPQTSKHQETPVELASMKSPSESASAETTAPPVASPEDDEEEDDDSNFIDEDEEALADDELLVLGGDEESESLSSM